MEGDKLMRYIDRIVRLVEEQINRVENYGIIKLENFPNPAIYLEVCRKIQDSANKAGIKVISKLSRERYEEWNTDQRYKTSIERLVDLDLVELEGSLTKWRNDSFFSNFNKKVFIILMETELVVDKGGLEDFYTISPETIDNVVGENYSEFFNMYSDAIDNIYINIFYYIEKDLYKLDRFAYENNDIEDEGKLIQLILESLYEIWGLPNFITLLETKGVKLISDRKRRIKLFEKAYKFNRRIGMDNLPSSRKLKELNNKIDKYYETKKNDINNEFDKLFPHYENYSDLKNDIIDYFSGINVDEIREKLSICDFVTIDKIIGLKILGPRTTQNKDTKVYGNPINSMVLSLVTMFLNIDSAERNRFDNIIFEVEEIKLANISPNGRSEKKNPNLLLKWNQMRRFLNGIERVIEECYLKEICDELEVEIRALTDDGEIFYPFIKDSISKLFNNEILKEAAIRDSVSKITFTIEINDNTKLKGVKDRFVWYIFDTDAWINVFDIIDDSDQLKEDKIDELAFYIPNGVSIELKKLLNATNNDEFYEIYGRAGVDYKCLAVDTFATGGIDVKAYRFGKSFIAMLRNIENHGFFGTFKDSMREYLDAYKKLSQSMIENLSNATLEPKINSLAKAMTIISNENDLYKKGAEDIMFPAYHPVMLEKVMQRYVYLCMGIDELLKNTKDLDGITKKYIERNYLMIDQLATITSATGATLNDKNSYENSHQTFGYRTIFGKVNGDVQDVNFNIAYTKEDDLLESISSKLISTPVSRYIEKTIFNYLAIYPYKMDGIKIMFFNPANFSDIIDAIKRLIVRHKKEKKRLILELIIYTDDYRCKVYNYLKSWIDNNINEDDLITLTAKIKYIDYKFGNSKKIVEDSLQKGDITFLFEIMEEIELREEPVFVNNGIDTMYPSTYLPIPKNNKDIRNLSISQLQFECEEIYTQLIANIKSPHIVKGSYQLYKQSKLRNQFVDIIQVLHEKSNWVVVLDENVDPSLIKFTGNEIIGYSTGEGYFGELNATISSSPLILIDIKRYLIKRMKIRFNNWSYQDIKEAAKNCIDYAYELDGAEVLKAINPSDESINNYLAFYLSSMIEQKSFGIDEYYYRKLLSLDLYDQLFGNEIEYFGGHHTRPDFILIEIPKLINNILDHNSLNINIRVIECKMGGRAYMDSAIDKAKNQVFEGYTALNKIWMNTDGVKKRYWQNQLYKILTLQNSVIMSDEELDLYAKKAMKIFEGNYKINFSNYIYTYNIEQEESFSKIHHKEDIIIEQINIGNSLVRDLLLQKNSTEKLNFIFDKRQKNIVGSEEKIEVENNMYLNSPQKSTTAEVAVSYKNIKGIEDDKEKAKDKFNLNNSKYLEMEIDKDINNNVKVYKDDKCLIEHHELINIFKSYTVSYSQEEEEKLKNKLDKLVQELKLRKIKIFIKDYLVGPDIIRVIIDLATGVNIDQFKKFSMDMKLWLGVNERPYIYIKDGKVIMDIIRDNRQTVGLKNMLIKIIKQDILTDRKDKFYALLGADILGNPKVIDFSDSNTPHLLVAGQTGSGKSVLLNSILLSIMMMYTSSEVEMILVDPKFIELTVFDESPYTKVVATEAEVAVELLEGLVEEMNSRYKLFMETRSKSIASYNDKVDDEKKIKRILMVFDEYAALMEENKDIAKRLESTIKILSQKARAAGIHLIICTQSPRADILTTTIRNNLTARVGLRVADSTASGLILDSSGAETLLGKGDMLLKTAASSELFRAKSPYVTENEIDEFVRKCKEVYKK